MNKVLTIVSVIILGMSQSFAYAPDEIPSSQSQVSINQQIADSASDLARCFNANMRTGADYMAVLAGCMQRASLSLPEPSNFIVADRASDINRCFNNGLRTGVDYMALLQSCMSQAANELFLEREEQMAQIQGQGSQSYNSVN